MPDGSEVGRARNLKELMYEVSQVPLESFLHHGRANHFSTWFYLHGRYELAEILRPINGSGEDLRERMLMVIQPYLDQPRR